MHHTKLVRGQPCFWADFRQLTWAPIHRKNRARTRKTRGQGGTHTHQLGAGPSTCTRVPDESPSPSLPIGVPTSYCVKFPGDFCPKKGWAKVLKKHRIVMAGPVLGIFRALESYSCSRIARRPGIRGTTQQAATRPAGDKTASADGGEESSASFTLTSSQPGNSQVPTKIRLKGQPEGFVIR